MADCGGCNGLGNHRRDCPQNPEYTHARMLADRAESLGDQIGASNPGAANHLYAAAGLLMVQHREQITSGERPS